jgi:hypothetical protein
MTRQRQSSHSPPSAGRWPQAFSPDPMPLHICAPPVFLATGEAGIVSWITPITSTPTGLYFTFIAATVDPSALPLHRYDVNAFLIFDGTTVEVGYARSSTATHAEVHFHAPRPAGLPGPPYTFTLVIEDGTGGARWETTLTLPNNVADQ